MQNRTEERVRGEVRSPRDKMTGLTNMRWHSSGGEFIGPSWGVHGNSRKPSAAVWGFCYFHRGVRWSLLSGPRDDGIKVSSLGVASFQNDDTYATRSPQVVSHTAFVFAQEFRRIAVAVSPDVAGTSLLSLCKGILSPQLTGQIMSFIMQIHCIVLVSFVFF